MLVNGRISSRSYPRYRLARRFFTRVLDDVDRFCMQSDESARRIIDIGADPAKVIVTGSLKFESLEPAQGVAAGRGPGRVLRYFRVQPSRLVFIAASTLKGEEAAVLSAFAAVRRLHPNALLIIAPRKTERFADVDALVRAEGYRVARRSELPVDSDPREDVVILDTIGELAQLFQIATVVFVGGSLVDQGGHNILEPAVHGKPIVFGPSMQNFAEIAATFLTSQAAIQVQSAGELTEVWIRLAGDSVERTRLGAAARAAPKPTEGPSRARSTRWSRCCRRRPAARSCIRSGCGRRRVLASQLTSASTRRESIQPSALLETPLSLWRRRWYAKDGRQQQLRHPVISVGNISIGGRGKTPLASLLASHLSARGLRPSILSRGYAEGVPTRGDRRRERRRSTVGRCRAQRRRATAACARSAGCGGAGRARTCHRRDAR